MSIKRVDLSEEEIAAAESFKDAIMSAIDVHWNTPAVILTGLSAAIAQYACGISGYDRAKCKQIHEVITLTSAGYIRQGIAQREDAERGKE